MHSPPLSVPAADAGPEYGAPPPSFPDHVRELLEREIVSGRLEPGRRVTEVGLARSFGVSRTPVREAMRVLEAQGLIVRRRGRDMTIAPRTTPAEAAVIFELRRPVESHLTALAAERIQPDELAALEGIQADFRAALARLRSQEDRHALVLLDSGFHWGIFRASRSDLVSIVHSYWGRHLRELGQRVYGDAPLEPFADQHDRILGALAGRDAVTARAVAGEHIDSGWRAAERSYEQDPAGDAPAEPA